MIIGTWLHERMKLKSAIKFYYDFGQMIYEYYSEDNIYNIHIVFERLIKDFNIIFVETVSSKTCGIIKNNNKQICMEIHYNSDTRIVQGKSIILYYIFHTLFELKLTNYGTSTMILEKKEKNINYVAFERGFFNLKDDEKIDYTFLNF